ncbi:hypothetical protein [Mycolicibacterium septicum]|uniref:hypothetical protein n=1 Tax=Mycolicibacterium septicum TaxID=98668 RepID=UPI001AF188A1|nr:hypothetical protein [Mycolicibacterium septicum]QRY51825.1 hypothetical protein JVX95_31375 [Mycolicibacterium septicum]
MARTPDIRPLVESNLTDYLIGRGYPRAEARKRAAELLDDVDKTFAAPARTDVHRSYYGGPSVHPGSREACKICPPLG